MTRWLTPDAGARVAPAFGVFPLSWRYLYGAGRCSGAGESFTCARILASRRSLVNRLSRSLPILGWVVNIRSDYPTPPVGRVESDHCRQEAYAWTIGR